LGHGLVERIPTDLASDQGPDSILGGKSVKERNQPPHHQYRRLLAKRKMSVTESTDRFGITKANLSVLKRQNQKWLLELRVPQDGS
jgi:hypothetical protein